eukprot:8372551-Lingulodinium_polyedra.AAC.1
MRDGATEAQQAFLDDLRLKQAQDEGGNRRCTSITPGLALRARARLACGKVQGGGSNVVAEMLKLLPTAA